MANDVIYSVISPETGQHKTVTRPSSLPAVSMAARPESLENKTVYLVDIGFGGGYEFMLRLQQWFAGHMPSVKTEIRRKPGHVFSDDDSQLWEEIKARGQAAVVGVAG